MIIMKNRAAYMSHNCAIQPLSERRDIKTQAEKFKYHSSNETADGGFDKELSQTQQFHSPKEKLFREHQPNLLTITIMINEKQEKNKGRDQQML